MMCTTSATLCRVNLDSNGLLPIRSRMKRTCKCQWQQKKMSFDRMFVAIVRNNSKNFESVGQLR